MDFHCCSELGNAPLNEINHCTKPLSKKTIPIYCQDLKYLLLTPGQIWQHPLFCTHTQKNFKKAFPKRRWTKFTSDVSSQASSRVCSASMPNKLIAFLAQPAFCTLVQILCSYFNSGLKKIKISFYLIFIALTLKGRNEALWSECVSRTLVKYSFGCKKLVI